MKKFLLIGFYILFSNLVHAQTYGNEWINFNQDYYKIKIGKEGIYRIDYNTLQTIGFPLSSTDPQYIQLWINGNEQPILIEGEIDGKLDAGDFIEFYGTYNDGKLDAPLFSNPSEQPHQYMSLYSDTATYFLTVSSSTKGKRIIVNNDKDYSGKTADPYFMYEQSVWYNNKNGATFWDGFGFSNEGFHSDYTEGEGWLFYSYNSGINATFSTKFLSTIGPNPYIEVLAHPRGNNTSSYDADGFNNGLQLSIQPSGTIINSQRVTGIARYFFQDSITDRSLIGATSTSFRTTSYLLAKSPHSVSYFKLIYPRLFNLGDSSNLKFNSTSNNTFIKFTKYSPTKSKPIIYDYLNFTKSIGEINTGEMYCNLSSTGSNKALLVLDESSIISVQPSTIKFYKFNEIKLQSTYTYLIISNQRLDSGAHAYQNFLATSLGGNQVPYLAFVNDIYDQFYYGLKHPMALKNFCKFSINNSPSLKYLLLLGKGQKYNNTRFNSIVNTNFDLVPTYGTPPTDYFFVSGYNGSTLNPLLATGRIPSANNNQIANYLKKLNDHQTYGYQPWKKKILHLAGGNNSSEVTQFSAYQNSFHNIVSQEQWGASKKLITKQDPSPVDSSLKTKIQSEINSGYALVDYFGHGSTQASDIDFGDAYQLNNTNKYPFFYFNGCGLGNTFDGSSIAEDFLFTKDKGAIGWMAQTTFGFISELYYYGLDFHQKLTENTSSSFAQNIANTINSYQNPSNPYNKAQCQQMLYMGDPSITIFDASNPDYTVDISKSSVFPKKVTAEADSFALVLTIQNTALFTSDSFGIKVKQKLPNGQTIYYPEIFAKGIGNIDTVVFWIKKPKGLNIKGSNTFTITLDSINKITEQPPLGESNNVSTLNYYFGSSSAQILFPRKEGIVNSTYVELVAQSLIYNHTNYNFIFELDTTPEFNSPYKKNSGSIYSTYIAKANFALLPIDSLDYYWRVKIDDGSGSGDWDVSTFSMIYNSPQGWSQGDIRKFLATSKNNIGYDSTNALKFSSRQSVPYFISTGGKTSSFQDRTIYHDGFFLNWGYFQSKGVGVVAYSVFNEERFYLSSNYNQTAKNPWWTTPFQYQTKYFYPPGVAKTCYYTYNTFNKTDRDSLLFLLRSIPKNYNLVMFNGTEMNVANWEPELLDELGKFGALKIRTVQEGEPYILIGQRGKNPGDAFEKLADKLNPSPGPEQSFTVTQNFDVLADSGQITSSIIGPAKSWKYFYRTLKKPDNTTDKVKFNIYGINNNGSSTLIISDISEREINLSSIDATAFPYLKIEADIEDSITKTPTDISRWTVLFDGYPEGLINPSVSLFQNKDTLEEGDTLEVKIAYNNVSAFDMDSILVLTTSLNDQNTKDTIELKKYKLLKSNDSLLIVRKIDTKGLSGLNILTVSVNPEMAQPEEYLFNNTWQFPYYIKTDQHNPYLDVVFDGRHITNLEIVSPNLAITITAVDENKFFYLNDPSYFRVKLKEPGSSTYRELDVTSDTFSFVAAKGPNDKSKLVFSPLNLRDGIYELSVTVRDAKGNFASDEDYKISFQVITKSTITNVYPYPNPFTTKTKFIFTLTGEKVPDYFKIAVISVSGTVVKEITLDELGPINIGNNITKYEWDGTDTYGDKLANGVYLYKVTAKLDGKDIELGESAGDSFFKKGFGKLYIMR